MDTEFAVAGLLIVALGVFFGIFGSAYSVLIGHDAYLIPFSFHPFWSPPSVTRVLGAHVVATYYTNAIGAIMVVIGLYLGLKGFRSTHPEQH
jgi:hypothetical protein